MVEATSTRSEPPKVAVVGAGAMGSIFGAAFAEAGAETVFVDVSAELVDRLNTHGLVIVGADGEERKIGIRATTDRTRSEQPTWFWCW